MSSPNPTPPAQGWRVTSQIDTEAQDPTGRFVPGYRVYFTTAAGVQGSVFVPRENYNVNIVQAAIGAHAAELDAVAALAG